MPVFTSIGSIGEDIDPTVDAIPSNPYPQLPARGEEGADLPVDPMPALEPGVPFGEKGRRRGGRPPERRSWAEKVGHADRARGRRGGEVAGDPLRELRVLANADRAPPLGLRLGRFGSGRVMAEGIRPSIGGWARLQRSRYTAVPVRAA